MPRKPTPEPVTNIPPGPIHFEVRINGKIALLQRVHSYKIDQQSDQIVVNASLRPESQPEPKSASPSPWVETDDPETNRGAQL
jgi:hypothetical protein